MLMAARKRVQSLLGRSVATGIERAALAWHSRMLFIIQKIMKQQVLLAIDACCYCLQVMPPSPCYAVLQVVSCLSNPIKDHMMGDDIEHEQQQSGACCQASCCDGAANGQVGPDGQDEGSSQGSSSDEEEEDGNEEEDGCDSGQADLVFPAMYSLAVAQLLDAHSHPVKVKDIKLDGDEIKLDLAVTMWKEGILSVQADPSKRKSGKKLKH